MIGAHEEGCFPNYHLVFISKIVPDSFFWREVNLHCSSDTGIAGYEPLVLVSQDCHGADPSGYIDVYALLTSGFVFVIVLSHI
jgi:hypothetical protein